MGTVASRSARWLDRWPVEIAGRIKPRSNRGQRQSLIGGNSQRKRGRVSNYKGSATLMKRKYNHDTILVKNCFRNRSQSDSRQKIASIIFLLHLNPFSLQTIAGL